MKKVTTRNIQKSQEATDFSSHVTSAKREKARIVPTKVMSDISGIPAWSLRKMVRENLIPVYSLNGTTYLFDVEEVIAFIKSHPVKK